MNTIKVEGDAVVEEEDSGVEVSFLDRQHKVVTANLPSATSYTEQLFKADEPQQKGSQSSSQGVATGQKPHPFNFTTIALFQTIDPHHARAIHTKVSATVGLGFQTPNDLLKKHSKITGEPLDPTKLVPEGDVARIDEVLNPLCDFSWQDTLNDAVEDMWQSGNGYVEVRRGDGNRVVGLHHIPSKEVWVSVEDHFYNRHYQIQSSEEGGVRLFSRFGDREDFLRRLTGGQGVFDFSGSTDSGTNVSEVIHLRRPSSLSRWYGFPDWVSAVAAIELVQCLTQHEYDFFQNRGVPEFMLFLIGQGLTVKDREKINTAMKSTIGLGNQSKSLLVTLKNIETKVQLEKLAMESKSDGSQFAGMAESLALRIVSAHGVPPLLAGIQVPGKLGASNEMIQAMQAFQTLVVEPMQRLIRQTLINTLGREESLGLVPGDFVLNTITDAIDVQKADTTARMRQSPQEAEAEGRDLDAGVKKDDRTEEEGAMVGALLMNLVDKAMDRKRGV